MSSEDSHAVFDIGDSTGRKQSQFSAGNYVAIYELKANSSYSLSVCAATAVGCGNETVIQWTTLPAGGMMSVSKSHRFS